MTHAHEVRSSTEVYAGRIISVRRDEVTMPGDRSAVRDVVVHPGAVGVVALDEAGRVLLVTQYRHPVGRRLAEIPAGLLDVDGEPPLLAAQRELAEEAGLAAESWHVLVDALTSPGMTNEALHIYLARGVRTVDRDVQEDEELELTSAWTDLGEAVAAVLGGEIENAMACIGILATAAAAREGFAGLRPADAPWPGRSGP